MKNILFLVVGLIFCMAEASASNCGDVNGVELPCFDAKNFYPYAEKPDGCSIPDVDAIGLEWEAGNFDNVSLGDYHWSFREACNKHDRCYFTLGTTFWECNDDYHDDLHGVCDGIESTNELNPVYLTAQVECGLQAEAMWTAVVSSEGPYDRSQRKQREYEEMVEHFLLTGGVVNLNIVPTIIVPLLLN